MLIKRKVLARFFLIVALTISVGSYVYGKIHVGVISAVKSRVRELKEKKEKKEEELATVKLAENTKVLSDETIQQLFEQEGSTYYFSGQAIEIGNLKTGDMIISSKGDGFLRKVVSISLSNNQYAIETADTTLEEAFEKLDFEFKKILDPSDLNSQKTPMLKKGVSIRPAPVPGEFYVELTDVVLYDHDGSSSTTNDQIIADGSITFKPSFDFRVLINMFTLKELKFVKTVKQTAKIEIRSNIGVTMKKEAEIAKYYFAPILVGPVVFAPEISLVIGADAKVGVEVTTDITQEAEFTVGLTYNDGIWNPVSDYSNIFQYNPPSLSTEGEIKGYSGPKLALKIYGFVGPYINVNGYLRLVAKTSPTPIWTLYGGLVGLGGVEWKILRFAEAGYQATLIDYEKVIASGTVNNIMPFNLNGTWNITLSPRSATSGCKASSGTFIVTATQTGTNVAATFAGRLYTGTVRGAVYTLTATYDLNGGSATDNIAFTLTSSSIGSGEVNWANTNGCSGVTSLSIVKQFKQSPPNGVVDSTGDVGKFCSIALDSNDNPHIVYYDATNDNLKYTKWTSATWATPEIIDSIGNTFIGASMVLDNNDKPHISYSYTITQKLKYANWNGSNWNKQEIDAGGNIEDTSIGVDNNNNPHIAYRKGGDLKYSNINNPPENVDTAGDAGLSPSITLDNNNYPHICYWEGSSDKLKYAERIGSWGIKNQNIDTPVDYDTSLKLDANGNPHMVYYHRNQSLKYAKWTGTSFSTQTIDSSIIVRYCSMVLDKNSNPHIAYYDETRGDLKYANWTGSTWSTQIIDSTGDVGQYSSIVLDSNDKPHIAYYDVTNKDLKYITLSP